MSKIKTIIIVLMLCIVAGLGAYLVKLVREDRARLQAEQVEMELALVQAEEARRLAESQSKALAQRLDALKAQAVEDESPEAKVTPTAKAVQPARVEAVEDDLRVEGMREAEAAAIQRQRIKADRRARELISMRNEYSVLGRSLQADQKRAAALQALITSPYRRETRTRDVTCRRCGGDGRIPMGAPFKNDRQCPACAGKGHTARPYSFTVPIAVDPAKAELKALQHVIEQKMDRLRQIEAVVRQAAGAE